ncbi:MAG: protein of unknown function precursor [Saprospiraceae bacterium]|nr:MAG: protein of unknown function precursor [Saprospiraceae bacterium]
MNKYLYSFVVFIILLAGNINPVVAQEEEKKIEEGWKSGAGIGLDFAQLFQLNPKQGAGLNRIGLGGATNFFANYRKDRLAWDNQASWQFGVQRLGAGIVAQGPNTDKVPFQKSIDELRINSKVGYATSENSNFFYAADFSFLSQLTPTYDNPDYAGNFLSDVFGNSRELSKLFSPATIVLSLGMNYKPSEKLSIYYSPLGAKWIIVADDAIAARGVHGNPVEGELGPDGLFLDFKNVDNQFGSLLKFNYADKYFAEKATFTSVLSLYSNYLKNPENIDIDWTNEFAVSIVKGLQLAVTVNVFYDDDVNVQITDKDLPNGVKPFLGKRVSLTEQLLIKYSLTF